MTVQTSYGRQGDTPARAGLVHGSTFKSAIAGRAAGCGAEQIITVTITADANDQAHVITVNGVEHTYTSDASGTKLEILTGLCALINADPVSSAVCYATPGTTTFTLTGRAIGHAFTYSESDANLTTAVTQAASSPADLPFGVGVQNNLTKDGHVQLPALGTAKVMTAVPTHVNDSVYGLNVTILSTETGKPVVYSATFVADGSATVKEIEDELTAELNLALPANTVLVADDDTTMTFTAEQAGLDFTVTAAAASSTGTWTFATTTANYREPFAGVSLHSQLAESEASAGVYAGGTIANIGENDIDVWVRLDASQAPTVGDPVYMRATACATEQAGAFRTSADATDCIPVPSCKWVAPSDGVVYRTGQDGNLIGLLRVQS